MAVGMGEVVRGNGSRRWAAPGATSQLGRHAPRVDVVIHDPKLDRLRLQHRVVGHLEAEVLVPYRVEGFALDLGAFLLVCEVDCNVRVRVEVSLAADGGGVCM